MNTKNGNITLQNLHNVQNKAQKFLKQGTVRALLVQGRMPPVVVEYIMNTLKESL